MPSAPSSPIPVIRTAMPLGPNSSARLLNKTSADGRCPFTRGSSLSTATSPSGKRFIFMCRAPGQIKARPASKRSPDCASFTAIPQISSRRRANISVNPSGMCCTMTMLPGKSAGNWDSTYCRACGPPVETPMATILLAVDFVWLVLFTVGRTTSAMGLTGTPRLSAAALILEINS